MFVMKLLLTSQGIQKELEKDFLSLLSKPPKDNRVINITTASFGDHATRPKWLDTYITQLNKLGITNIEELDIRDKSQKELNISLSNKDIIFVNGGNTFFLLDYIKKTGFDRIIKESVYKGIIYIGISAGSYITCPTIEQSTWEHQDRNRFGLTNLTALNFVPFLISAHFEEKYRKIIENAALKTKYPIVALNDHQAILVKDNKFKLVGEKSENFFNGFKNTF